MCPGSHTKLNKRCFKGQGAAANLERPEIKPVGSLTRAMSLSANVPFSFSLKEVLCCGQDRTVCGKLRPDLICKAEIEHSLLSLAGLQMHSFSFFFKRDKQIEQNKER